jgi:hypothetical protein
MGNARDTLKHILAVALLAGCGLGDRQAGVVSETTNGLAGRAVDADGRGVAAARVSWRPAAFLPEEGSKARTDTGSVTSGADGTWRLEGLGPGDYLLSVRASDGRVAALRRRVSLGSGTDSLPEAVVARAGRIVLRFAGTGTGSVRVKVYGTDLLLDVAAGDTAVLEGLGAEDYRVKVVQGGKALDLPEVPVAAASLTVVENVDPAQGTFQVTPPSQAALDSALVHAVLGKSGALRSAPFDSLVIRRGGALVGLRLSGIPLDSLPAAVGSLGFLDTLRINACRLKSLPDSLFTLARLKSLNLSYNSGLAVPVRLFGMASLTQLDLSGLDLPAVDPALSGLSALKELRLNNNPLVKVPQAVLDHPGLEILAMNECGIDSLPASLLASTLRRQLHLTGNVLTTLPDVFTAGHALEKLTVDRNQLTALPASLRLLSRLQILHLGQNRLCDVPEETRTFLDTVPGTAGWAASQTGC